ncbi:MAG: hypothetical protein J6N72_10465 [Psychrobacter sp.]|nr:hypothetical protein [Psychrobacter sp.]
MPNQHMSRLKKSTVARLKSYGLELLIEHDETSGKDGTAPSLYCKRTSNECVWVGIENKETPLINPTETVDRLVANYCRETLNCTVDDIIWCLIERYEDEGTRYRVINSDGRWGNKNYMLIYMLKKGVVKAHKVESISYGFEQDLRNMMKEHAIEYTTWLNNEILKLTVAPKQKTVNPAMPNLSKTTHGIIPISDEIDVFSNKLIDDVLDHMLIYKKSGINLFLFTDRDMPSYVDKQLCFIHTMEHVFGFTPVLGWCDFNVQERIFNIHMSLDSLPPFSVLKTTPIKNIRGEKFEVLETLMQSIAWLVDNEHFELPTPFDVIETLVADTPYSEWQPVFLNALMLTLCTPVATMRLQKTSIHLAGENPSHKDNVVTTSFYAS